MLFRSGSSLNVLPKKALDRLDCEGLTLKPSNIVVRAFDGSKRMVHREVDIPIKVGIETFNSTFYVMDICPSYSCLLGKTVDPLCWGSYLLFTPNAKVSYSR